MGFQFYETRMGHEFFGRDIPKVIKELERMNKLKEQEIAERKRTNELLEELNSRIAYLR